MWFAKRGGLFTPILGARVREKPSPKTATARTRGHATLPPILWIYGIGV